MKFINLTIFLSHILVSFMKTEDLKKSYLCTVWMKIYICMYICMHHIIIEAILKSKIHRKSQDYKNLGRFGLLGLGLGLGFSVSQKKYSNLLGPKILKDDSAYYF